MILSIIIKEFHQIRRDPRTLIVALILPCLMLILFGYGITLDINHIPAVVFKQDPGAESRKFIGKFVHSGFFDVVAYVNRLDALDSYFDRGKAKVGLVIPRNFSKNLLRGEDVEVQVIIDGTDANTARVVLGHTQKLLQKYSATRIIKTLTQKGLPPALIQLPLDYRPRVWYNPKLRSVNFFVPGLIGIIMMMLTVFLTALTITRERELGTIEGLMVSPVRGYQLIIGKISPYVAIALVEVTLVLIVGRFIFGVPVKGSLLLLSGATGIFLLACLGLGLLISTVTVTQQTAMVISFLTALLPSIILSGFIFPIRSMPVALQAITYLIPARFYLVVLRSILLKGAGLNAVGYEIAYLILFATVVLTVSAVRMRKIMI